MRGRSDSHALDARSLGTKEVVVGQLLQLVGHEHAFGARNDAHVVDEKDSWEPIDLENGGYLGLLV